MLIENVGCNEIFMCNCKEDVLASLAHAIKGDTVKMGAFEFYPNENYKEPKLTTKGEPFKNGATNCSKLITKVKATPQKLWSM